MANIQTEAVTWGWKTGVGGRKSKKLKSCGVSAGELSGMSICVITKKEKRKHDFVYPLQTCRMGSKKINGLPCPQGNTGFHGAGWGLLEK